MSRASTRFDNGLRYVDATDPRNTQFTPDYVLGPVRADLYGRIELDPCTTEDNPVGADWFYTAEKDGLAQLQPPEARHRRLSLPCPTSVTASLSTLMAR